MASSLYNKVSRIQQMKNAKIKAENLRLGVNVFGVNGTYTSDANASYNDLASGKTAYVNGNKISGSLAVYNATTRNIPWSSLKDDSTNQCIRINYSNTTNLNTRPNYHINCGNAAIYDGAYMEIGYSNLADKIGLNPLTLKKDVTVLGVTGQYDASTEFSGIKMDPVVASDSAISLTASITEVSGLDMTQGTNLAYYFNSLFGLTSLSNLNAPNVTNLYSFCNSDYKLQKIEYVNFYSEEQTEVNCAYMFNSCRNLIEVPNTLVLPKIINSVWYMFDECCNMVNFNTPLNISNTSASRLFYNCTNLVNVGDHIHLPIGVCNTSLMFYNCVNLDIANVNLHGITLTNRSSSMFWRVKNSNRAGLNKFFANIASAYVNNGSMLSGCCIESVDCDLWDEIPQLRNTSNLYSAFTSCKNLKSVNLYRSNYSSLSFAFESCSNLTDASLSSPNMTITSMTNTFYYCTNLANINIDINSRITSLTNSFMLCTNLTNINFHNSLSQDAVVYMPNTFYGCTSLPEVKANINAGVANLYNSFYNCTNLKAITFNSTNNWFDSVTCAHYTFYNCSNLQTIDNKKDIVLSFTNSMNYGIFYNCANLKINSLTYSINNTGSIGHITNLISNNPFIVDANITISGQVENSYWGINTVYLIHNCTNLQSCNINLIDNSTNTNTWNIAYILCGSPNIKTLNLNIFTNGNRVPYGVPILACNIDNFYYNVSREVSKTSTTEVNVYSCNVNNLYGYINGVNANLVLRWSNINNVYLNLGQTVSSISYYYDSIRLNTTTIDINHSEIEYINLMAFENILTPATSLNINCGNAKGYKLNRATTVFRRLNTIETINANFSNLTNIYSLAFNQLTNARTIDVNFASLINIEYSLYLNTMSNNCTHVNLYMPNLQQSNYSFSVSDCYGLTDLTLGWGKPMERIYEFYFRNCRNLANIHMDYPNLQNIYINAYIQFDNCKNLTDDTIDNLFGMLSNLKYIGTKFINYSFRNCNLSQARAQNLANYNNLISAGWTY